MCLALAYAEMRVGCCQKQDLRDGEDSQDGLVWGWRLLSESGFGGFSGSGQSNGPGLGPVVQRVVFGSCQVLRPVMTILGGKVVTTR